MDHIWHPQNSLIRTVVMVKADWSGKGMASAHLALWGVGHSWTADSFCLSGAIPLPESTWANMIPQTYLNVTSFLSQLASDSQILLVGESSAAVCQWNVLEYYQHTVCGDKWKAMVNLVHQTLNWKELGAPIKPNGIHRNWKSPMPGPGQKAVLKQSSGWTGSFQYPECRSRVVKIVDPAYLSCTSSGNSKGYTSFCVFLFSSW